MYRIKRWWTRIMEREPQWLKLYFCCFLHFILSILSQELLFSVFNYINYRSKWLFTFKMYNYQIFGFPFSTNKKKTQATTTLTRSYRLFYWFSHAWSRYNTDFEVLLALLVVFIILCRLCHRCHKLSVLIYSQLLINLSSNIQY
jgi:hypothetical protein